MSGPKSSLYILTELQRQILEEQRKRELERAKAEQKLKSSVLAVKDLISSVSFDKALSEESKEQLGSDYGYEEKHQSVSALLHQVNRIEKRVNFQELDSIKIAIDQIDTLINEAKRQSGELRQLEERCRKALRQVYSADMDAAFETVPNKCAPANDSTQPTEESSVTIELNGLLSEGGLSPELTEEIKKMILEYESIKSEEYRKNFKSLVIIPLIRKCRDYQDFYKMYYDEYSDLINEYRALCVLIGSTEKDIPFSEDGISLLRYEINKLKEASAKSSEQAYIQRSLDEVMTEMGYSVIGSREVTKRNGKHFRNELYTYGEGTAVNVTYSSDGRIAMELGGLDSTDRMPTASESSALCEEMEDFCEDFKEIERRLLARSVVMASRISLLPPDSAYAQIINTSDYQMRTHTQRFTVEQHRGKASEKRTMKAE